MSSQGYFILVISYSCELIISFDFDISDKGNCEISSVLYLPFALENT